MVGQGETVVCCELGDWKMSSKNRKGRGEPETDIEMINQRLPLAAEYGRIAAGTTRRESG